MKNFVLIFSILISFLSCAQKDNSKKEDEGFVDILSKNYNVSLIQLISNPEKYHKKPIQVMGYLHLEFEGNAIYVNELDYKHSLDKNGFWVSFKNKELMLKAMKLNDKYVLIEGVFDAENFGHMGMWSGEVKNITRIDAWGNID